MKSVEVDITPDKSLVKKLGMVGYRTEQAVAELIDNSIDARLGDTEQIDVNLDSKLGCITVQDNGSGMNLDRLRDALTIGKETKDKGRLGQFGLGMKSACSSLGRAFTLVTSTFDSENMFTATYDEDKWLQNHARGWTNFEINREDAKDDWHGTIVTISKIKVPLYPNQLLNFRKRFGIRYGPYITSGQITIRVNGRDCSPAVLDVVDSTRRDVHIAVPSGGTLHGWVGLRARRSIKGDYGIHLYWNKRLISAFDKFGIRTHPEAAKVVGEMMLDHVPVNFHKTGFLVESPEYRDAAHYFAENSAVREVLRMASSSSSSADGTQHEIESVLSFDRGQSHLSPLAAKMSTGNASRLLRDADSFVQEKDGTTFNFEFDDSDACSIRNTEDGGGDVQVRIGRKNGAFRLFKNPLFFVALLRIESELVAGNKAGQDFVERRNRMLEEFIAKRLPQQKTTSRPSSSRKESVHVSRYTLQYELVELHDHLKEHFGSEFQFTGLSTLASFLQNAYSRMIYSVYTTEGAGQVLCDLISDKFDGFVTLLNPKRRDFEVLFESTQSARFIAVREYGHKLTSSWAEPEKAWLDLYFDVTRGLVPSYRDELVFILEELLDAGLATAAKIRARARNRKILGEIDEYLPGE